MAKSKKKQKESQRSAGGYLYTQQAEMALLNYLTKMPDVDEVLRKAGVTRHRLSVLMYDDEIYQCVEKRQDKLESSPFRLDPESGIKDSIQTKILTQQITKWWSELVLGTQNARWYGYSVIEAVYNKEMLHIEKNTITPFVGWGWIGVKPMQWFEPKNDGRLILQRNYNSLNKDLECDQNLKYFLTQCKPNYENPLGEALFSRLYWLWFFKNGTTKFWAKFVERFGNPLLLGKSANVNAMMDALLQAHASSVLSLNNGESVEILSASSNGNGGSAAFESFDKKIEKSIQKVVLGQTLTSGTDGSGSRALGEVHLEVQNNKVNADIRMITSTIQAIVDALCALNGWEKHTIVIGDEKSLKADQADRDVKLKNAGANLTKQYFQRNYDLLDGDVAETSAQNGIAALPQFKALPNLPFKFKAGKQNLSADQLEVEELTTSQEVIKLLDQKQVNELIQSSKSPEELAFNLMQLIPGATQSEFTANLEQALFTAGVLGCVTAK
ncbi:phage portal protein family protein [Acinetobacter bereziniae]|uniref:phage portal protein family protein n=1 Tax=Acinetobacter bereziniae TaxID=106648 RepID=UPI003AF72378